MTDPPSPAAATAPGHRPGRWAWCALLVVLVLAAAVRYRLRAVPLERDEGEYAYAGQLLLQGVLPWSEIYNMKLPGTYGAYAAILAVFGQTASGIHLGLLAVNALSIVLLFLLARRLADPWTALYAAASYALLSTLPSVQGVFANAEHFVVLPALAGLLALLAGLDRERSALLFASGVLLGLAVLAKQHGVGFAAAGGLYLLVDGLRRQPRDLRRLARRCAWFAGGLALPVAATFLVLYLGGVFEKFWFWTVTYASSYAAAVPLEQGLGYLKGNGGAVVAAAVPVWVLAAVGVVAIPWDRRPQQRPWFTALFVLFSFLAVWPGLYFRPHYFALALPAAALTAGLGLAVLVRAFGRRLPPRPRRLAAAVVAAATLAVPVYQHRGFLLTMTAEEVARDVYGLNPFPESERLAAFLREQSDAGDRVAVIGSEPQIYFYAQRRAATGYIYTYALMENQPAALEMQEEMIREIEAAAPRFLVWVNVSASWLKQPTSPTRIFDWFRKYRRRERYRPVALVEIKPDGTEYHWGPRIPRPEPASVWIAVHRRNGRLRASQSE